MARKIAKGRILIVRKVGFDASCNLAECKIVALLFDVNQDLLLHLVGLIMLLIRLARFDAERVRSRGFNLCKKDTREKSTRILLMLQGVKLSTLNVKLSTMNFSS